VFRGSPQQILKSSDEEQLLEDELVLEGGVNNDNENDDFEKLLHL
jgi:hypothetical protein